MSARRIVVAPYDPEWPVQFAAIRERLLPAVGTLIVGCEHVGSTSVPGLAAKPVIDLDLVVATDADLPPVIAALQPLGYTHVGDRGIAGRHAFEHVMMPRHHLYVCVRGSLGLRNHLVLRDHLRAHPGDARHYAALKQDLASRANDVAAYVEGKTAFITDILARYDAIDAEDLAAITKSNRAVR